MERIKALFANVKNRIVQFLNDFKTFDITKKLLVIAIFVLCLAVITVLFLLLRSSIGKIIITIGVILFIAGIVIGVKEKSAFLAVVIILVSMIPIGLGNLILPKNAEEPTTAPVIEKSIADVAGTEIDTNEPTTTMETTTEEPETEPPETDALETEPPTQAERDYVVNTSSGKFHYPSCSSVKKMASHNRADYHCTRDELISYGYEPCGQCHP